MHYAKTLLTSISGGPRHTPSNLTMHGWFKPDITRASRKNSWGK